jgi:branched-chain amino acid transport system permease protein
LGFEVLALQLLNGLSHATTLFLMASGLTLIFGVTRIVNFAHGSFFMLGALWSAHAVTHWWPEWGESAWAYAGAMFLGACVAAVLGAITEVLLLKRMRHAPQLYQLVATFGLTLALHDAMRWFFGPEEVFAPRFPGLKGAIQLGESFFPTWQLFSLVLGPLVWLGLHLLLTRTLWGQRVKAATHDRDMLDALGVNPAPLMLGVVMLGCGLAGLAGALQLPREPAHLQMDVNVVVETFVVVVTGGLGSIGGAFAAALLIGVIHALGLSFFPQATLVLVFLTMAVVLVWRPQGLAGSTAHVEQRETVLVFSLWPGGLPGRALMVAVFVGLSLLAWGQGDYGRSLAEDVMVMMLFGLSLQWMMALGGLVSFGHAAFFALGAYGAALAHLNAGLGLPSALTAGMLLALGVAVVFGALVVRSSGVYLAMLSLALAQMVWAGATQWVSLTGGDNGLIGLRLISPEWRPLWDALLCAFLLLALAGMARVTQSSRGAALQALRDAPWRAAASGLPVQALRYQVFVGSATLAGVAGALWAAFKGAVFPSVASVAMSVDALLVILLGGVHQLWGAAVGSALLVWGGAELGQGMDYWRGLLGLVIMMVMVLAPSGVLGAWQQIGTRRRLSQDTGPDTVTLNRVAQDEERPT